MQESEQRWTFLTNHAHVLVCLSREPDLRLRDIATEVGITERAALGILRNLEAQGYVTRHRVGRRNQYVLELDLPLRHPLESDFTVRQVLGVLGENRQPQSEWRRANGDETASAAGGTREERRKPR